MLIRNKTIAVLLGIKPNFPSIGFGYMKTEGNGKIKKLIFLLKTKFKKKAKELLNSDNIFEFRNVRWRSWKIA